ncbi:DUF2071 domain-containing protein [Streptomyces sp. NPDC000983]|uniref:YqjF family protein n=1 Tax=Streptomyces sp. NPDC000983 TaxID=3154373 RepID=UPI00332177B3
MRHRRAPEALTPLAPRRVRRVLFRQYWRDLVFLHWEADPFEVARLLPPGTVPDLHHGRTYVGLVFFQMRDLALGPVPPLPYLGTFNEVNVRLYSRDELGRRGVVFLSLDCDRLLPAVGARFGFGLPYRWSRISRHWYGQRLVYRTQDRRQPRLGSHVWVDVEEEIATPRPLDCFLTNRWGLHGEGLGGTYYMGLTHPEWTFRCCDALDWDASLVTAAGVTPLRAKPDSVLFAPGVQVRFGLPVRLSHTPPGA